MLIKAWFSSIVIVLLGAMSFTLYYFDLTNILDWSILLVLIVTLIMTALVYLEQPHKKDFRKLQETYSEFLLQKDKKINELSSKNDVIFKTAMKNSDENLKLAELKRKMEEQINSLDEYKSQDKNRMRPEDLL